VADYLVDNEGDIYTVDAEVFARTYRKVDRGAYIKVTSLWAEVASRPGRASHDNIRTAQIASLLCHSADAQQARPKRERRY
jgi:hypothetical protein